VIQVSDGALIALCALVSFAWVSGFTLIGLGTLSWLVPKGWVTRLEGLRATLALLAGTALVTGDSFLYEITGRMVGV